MEAFSPMRCWSPATSISLIRCRAAIRNRRRWMEIRSGFLFIDIYLRVQLFTDSVFLSFPIAPDWMKAKIHVLCAASMDGHRVSRVYDGLLLDAGGTLLQLARPVEETYASIGRKYGLSTTEAEIKKGFRRAFSAPWPEKLRYQGDGRAFWKLVVSEATGYSDNSYFEEVYEYFANGDAWHLPHGAYQAMCLLKDAGVKLAVVSNFDTRLHRLLNELNVSKLFDAIIVSSEVGFEKPSPEIFRAALDKIGVDSSRAIHVGDDEKADKGGANSIGIDCWLWGLDVKSFGEITARILKPDSIGETE